MTTALPRPGVSEPEAWLFPDPRELQLDNGARVWLYDMPSQHVLSAQVVMDLPLSTEPVELEGIATIAVRASDEGSHDHPAAALAEAIEDLGAVYGGQAGHSATTTQLEVPSTRLAPALELLAEIITRPAYADADIERHVSLRLAEIEQALVRSSSLAQLTFQNTIFDPALRSGRPAAGRRPTVAAITPASVRKFHDRWWRPQGATIIVAGALPSDVDDLVAAAFSGWQSNGQRPEHLAARPNPQAPLVRLVHRPDSVQADLRIGMVGPDRHDPRWAALEIAASAVGGSFGSRLNRVLREERGYTYGAHASFRPLRSAGTFTVSTSCRTEVAAAATAEALNLLEVAADPLSSAEVTDARTYLLGIAPLHFQTADTIADQAAALAGAAMPATWVNQHQARLTRTTTLEASEAFTQVVQPELLSIVLCGDAERLLPDLADFGLDAEVVEVEA